MNDTHRRSVAKAFSWRAFATLDTLVLAFIFTGSIGAALSITGLELFTKTFWYYCHERLWVHAPRLLQKDYEYLALHLWSVLKAVSWRLWGSLDTFVLAFLVTGHLGTSISIGGAEVVTKITLYYIHERIWAHVGWGMQ
ncbi:MAG: DUF2061 domain-containing protein [Patescibacteria group bacterium]|nr:DUF2061 domain-containing protein [Patescibacteria group bacterium]